MAATSRTANIKRVYRKHRRKWLLLAWLVVISVTAAYFVLPNRVYRGQHFDITYDNRKVILATWTLFSLDKNLNRPRSVVRDFLKHADAGESEKAKALCTGNHYDIHIRRDSIRGEFEWRAEVHLEYMGRYQAMDNIVLAAPSIQKSGYRYVKVVAYKNNQPILGDLYVLKRVDGIWRIAGLL